MPVLQQDVRLEGIEATSTACQLAHKHHHLSHDAFGLARFGCTGLDHDQITRMHGDLRLILPLQFGTVPGMIEISMGDDDELQFVRQTPALQQLPFKPVPLLGNSRVNENVTFIYRHEKDVDKTEIDMLGFFSHSASPPTMNRFSRHLRKLRLFGISHVGKFAGVVGLKLTYRHTAQQANLFTNLSNNPK